MRVGLSLQAVLISSFPDRECAATQTRSACQAKLPGSIQTVRLLWSPKPRSDRRTRKHRRASAACSTPSRPALAADLQTWARSRFDLQTAAPGAPDCDK